MVTIIESTGCASYTEKTPYSHRHAYRAVLRMIEQNRFVDNGSVHHELVSIIHDRSYHTSMTIRLNHRDLLFVDIVTQM